MKEKSSPAHTSHTIERLLNNRLTQKDYIQDLNLYRTFHQQRAYI